MAPTAVGVCFVVRTHTKNIFMIQRRRHADVAVRPAFTRKDFATHAGIIVRTRDDRGEPSKLS